MTRQFLNELNGNKNGEFKKYLDNFEGEPRIAWYPSAGEDFRPLLFLHPGYSKINPSTETEPQAPDLFLFTDYFPWNYSQFLDSIFIYSDDRTMVIVEFMEELPILNLPLHEEIVGLNKGAATDRIVFLKIKVDSVRMGIIYYPVLYAFAENEAFFCDKLIPTNATIAHIIHVRYGGGCGGGGRASGVWLLNVLEKLNCELFITDGHYCWQSGDLEVLKLCADIPKESTTKLTSIKQIPSKSWSGHGDVSWNLVSRI